MTDRQPPARYTVGLVQMAMSADPDANLKKAVAKVSEAAAAGARLVCLPELFRSQYFAQHEDPALFDLAEPDRKSTRLNSSHITISYAVFCLKKKTHKMTTL